MMKRIIKYLINNFFGNRSDIYFNAVENRLNRLPIKLYEHIKKLNRYDEQILKYHVGSSNKKPNLIKVKMRMAMTYDFVISCIGELKENDTIIDVGAASGLFIEIMGKKGMGVDIWPPNVNEMKNSGIDSVLCSAESLPFDNNKFDYGFSFECFEHAKSPLLLIEELTRVCKKGIFVSVPYRITSQIVKKETGHPPDQHIFELSINDIERLSSHANLKLEKIKKLNFYDKRIRIRTLINQKLGYYGPSIVLLHLSKIDNK